MDARSLWTFPGVWCRVSGVYWGGGSQIKTVIYEEELQGFFKRAREEMSGEDGEFDISYLGLRVTVFCQKGIPQKVRIISDGRTIYRRA